jgi:hypothetical protein
MLRDLPSGNRVCDHLRPAIKVEVSASFQVYDEARISEKVRQPVPRARGPGDEEAAVDIEHPDLDSTRLSGSAAGRSDIDRRIVGELASDGLHRPDVRAAAPDGGARRSTSAAPTLPPDTSDDMPIGRGRGRRECVVRAEQEWRRCGYARATAELDWSLEVARGCGDDGRDNRIPLETGLARDGDEVVHSKDRGNASRCKHRLSEPVTGGRVCAGHVEHHGRRGVKLNSWRPGSVLAKAKRGPRRDRTHRPRRAMSTRFAAGCSHATWPAAVAAQRG